MTEVDEIKLLDHGYLKLIETWGSDERIVEAARMSTGKGFLGWPGDEKLLRYLWENKHATPFEMAGMIVEVKAPIMVFREWHRHRTQCLAGDTMINLISPRGTTYKRSIKELFQLKHGGVVDQAPTRHRNGYSKAGMPVDREARRKNPWRTRVLPNCQNRVLRTLDEQTGTYRFGFMKDVWESGGKEIWEVATEAGVVHASTRHPFFTRGGWAEVRDLRVGELLATSGRVAADARPIPPILRQGIGVWTTMMRRRLILSDATCHICGQHFTFDDLQLDHVVPVSVNLKRALDETNLEPACVDCHRKKTDAEQPDRRGQCKLGLIWSKILRAPVRVAEEMTYDLEMIGPDHNYVANGLVVHNSYNEMSARYVPLPNENYIPTVERLLINSKTNKQAGTIAGSDVLTGRNAELFRVALDQSYTAAEKLYQVALQMGVPKELARVHLPVGRYSKMRASTNLRNWLTFLTLRRAPGAQFEIRQYANGVGDLIAERFPRTWALFSADG